MQLMLKFRLWHFFLTWTSRNLWIRRINIIRHARHIFWNLFYFLQRIFTQFVHFHWNLRNLWIRLVHDFWVRQALLNLDVIRFPLGILLYDTRLLFNLYLNLRHRLLAVTTTDTLDIWVHWWLLHIELQIEGVSPLLSWMGELGIGIEVGVVLVALAYFPKGLLFVLYFFLWRKQRLDILYLRGMHFLSFNGGGHFKIISIKL